MKYLIAFLTGAAAGVVGTYLYFSNKIETQVAETVNAEMEKFFKRQENLEVPNDVEPESEEDVKVSDIPETGEKTSIVEMTEIIRTNYRPTDNDGIEEDDDEEDEDYISDEELATLLETSQKRMSESPHLITEDERDTCRGYDAEEYTWFPEGDILTDSLDRQVDDITWYVAPVEWKKELADKPSIVIRIPADATDITIYNNNYERND
jgi:hypothetical protein